MILKKRRICCLFQNPYNLLYQRVGYPSGMVTTYYLSGQKEMEGMMDEGTQVGEWKWWHEDGKKQGDQLFWEYEELIKIEKYENGEFVETELK